MDWSTVNDSCHTHKQREWSWLLRISMAMMEIRYRKIIIRVLPNWEYFQDKITEDFEIRILERTMVHLNDDVKATAVTDHWCHTTWCLHIVIIQTPNLWNSQSLYALVKTRTGRKSVVSIVYTCTTTHIHIWYMANNISVSCSDNTNTNVLGNHLYQKGWT